MEVGDVFGAVVNAFGVLAVDEDGGDSGAVRAADVALGFVADIPGFLGLETHRVQGVEEEGGVGFVGAELGREQGEFEQVEYARFVKALPEVLGRHEGVGDDAQAETHSAEGFEGSAHEVVQRTRFPWTASGRAATLDLSDGVTKIIADPETDVVLGVGIAGSGAGELISEGALAIEMGALTSDIHLTIHPHPTLGETIMESAEIIFGSSTHLYRK